MKIINYRLSEFKESSSLFEFYLDSIYLTICQLDNEYPNFNNWYYQKVKNGILIDKREIIFNIIDNYISGIAILKMEDDENKVCTLRVPEMFQKMGIGQSLLLDSFEYLNTQYPLITVNSQKHNQFKKLFSYFGFEKAEIYNQFYNIVSNEISYNGCLI